MAKKPLPSPVELRQLLEYDPHTGVLRWLERSPEIFGDPLRCRQWNTRFAGRPAGTIDRTTGYLCFNLGGRRVLTHRAAWAIHYGEWPAIVDHANGIKTDNRLANLASGSQADNMKNLRRNARNKSGVTGVTWDAERGKWHVSIGVNGKTIGLGRTASLEEAAAMRREAEKRFGFKPRHGS